MAEREPLLCDLNQRPRESEIVESGRDTKTSQEIEINWKHETTWILSNSAQLAGTYLLQYFYNLVIIVVVSRLGREELAAVSLGITTMNICGFAIFEGIATSLDTLCSQAYGSGNLTHVGLHMQRNILLLLLVSVPIGGVWMYSPWILHAILPQPQLAPLAGTFLRISLIGVPGYATFEAGKRFMQAQGDFTASLVVLMICAPINVLLNWLFVFRLDWGVAGAALAAALTNDVRPVLLVLYVVVFQPSALQCWQQPTAEVLRNWGPMLSLSVPGAVMTLCEWFTFEILTFTTSFLSVAHLAAQTILATVCVLLWHIPFSASVAVSTRIGFFVGADSLSKAKGLVKLYAPIFAVCGLLEMAALLLLGKPIARFLTQDDEVQSLVIQYMPLVAVFVIFDATTCCCHGILRGLGRQAIAGWAVFIINNLYALPVAVYLELGPPHLGLYGVWIGTTTCLVLVTAVESIMMRAMNWQKCVTEARKREHHES